MSAPFPQARFMSAAPWPWLAALAVVTLLSLGGYAGVQQVLRSGADDPQVQLAEDAAARLAAGEEAGAVVPAGRVDLARSLSPWVAVARVGAGAVAAGGELAGAPPRPPEGVLEHAVRQGANRVTWMPAPGLRFALVAVSVRGHPGLVVMAGRSLREVEERVDRIGRICLLAWAASVAVVACAWGLSAWGRPRASTA